MRHRSRIGTLSVLLVASSLAALPPATAVDEGVTLPGDRIRDGADYSAPIMPSPPGTAAAAGTQGLFDADPLGIVPSLPYVQRYSLDIDHFEVWLCGDTGYTMNQAIAALEAATVNHFDALSLGRYRVVFSPGGLLPNDPYCLSGFTIGDYSPVGSPEGIFIIDAVTGGGYASPGWSCYDDPACSQIPSTFPGNARYAVIGAGTMASLPSVVAHELGHTLQWPHSYSGYGWEYDNPIDLMSGNLAWDGLTNAAPYGSLSYNRYQSGWVDPSDVVIAGAAFQEVTLQPFDAAGTQLIAVLTSEPGILYVLGARTRSAWDPIPVEWEGVEVYLVTHECDEPGFNGLCPGIWREHIQQPPNPDGVEHVLQPGESIVLEGISVTVTQRSGTGFTVELGDPNNSLPFVDIAASGFIDDIVWLVDEAITKGCNPPVNSQYCPSTTVTRGEMAAFLVRALELTDDGGGNFFTDDDGSVFEADIAKLAAAGITKGCNPPDNTHYCPYDRVTREQMAAFLVRAYGFVDDGGGNFFTDDDGSVFEADIAKLAAAGVTKGCNPPDNTDYCPLDDVTREQMAAFLHRAAR